MSNQNRTRHGLEDFLERLRPSVIEQPRVTIQVESNKDFLNIRGPLAQTGFVEAISRHLGQSLPSVPNTVSNGAHRIYWLGPSEWLVESVNNLQGVCGRMALDLAKANACVTAMGGGYVSFQVEGEAAEMLLGKGCTLDLHPTRFSNGSCAQTGLAKSTVVLARQSDAGIFDVIVRRSFAEYLAAWFYSAGHEYGLRFLLK